MKMKTIKHDLILKKDIVFKKSIKECIKKLKDCIKLMDTFEQGRSNPLLDEILEEIYKLVGDL